MSTDSNGGHMWSKIAAMMLASVMMFAECVSVGEPEVGQLEVTALDAMGNPLRD